MEENKTWLSALYNHPKRDEIIKAYIYSYFNDDDLSIKEVKLTKLKDGENVLHVIYNTNCYFDNTFKFFMTSKYPLDINLYIGEYFRFEQHDNIVTREDKLPKKYADCQKEKFRNVVVEAPTYIFNEINNLCKGHDVLGRGNNTHHIMKILEILNEGVTIKGETFNEMLERKNRHLMAKQIEKDREKGVNNEAHYEHWFKGYFIEKINPLTQYRKNYQHLFDLPIM